jgi:hypothetical protein
MKIPAIRLVLLALPAAVLGACYTPPPVTVYEVRPTTVYTTPRTTAPTVKSAGGGYSNTAEGFRAVEKPSTYTP